MDKLLLVLAFTAVPVLAQPSSDAHTAMAMGKPLVDYRLAYSTYFGGSDADAVRQIKPQTDSDGGYWVYGATQGSIGFVDNGGGFDTTAPGGFYDLWIAKLDASMSTVECASYLGTTGEDRSAYGLHVFPNNEPLLTGFTDGASFPTTPNAYDPTYNGGDDAFLTRFSSDCASLTWSTFYGGSGLETPRGGFMVDGAEDIYMVGETASTDLPGVSGHYDATQNGSSDGFVAVWNASGQLQRATYVGGSGFDMFSGVALYGNTVYLEGWTNSPDLPTTGNAAVRTDPGGNSKIAGWLPKDLSSLTYLTYVGGAGNEFGEVYPTLNADGSRFYTSGSGFSEESTYQPTPNGYDTTQNGGEDCAVTAFDTATGAAVWTTFLGGSGDEGCERPTVDANGNVLVFGSTYSADFPVTAGALDETHNGDRDVFFSVLSADGQSLLYSTFIGGPGEDRARGGYVFGDEVWITGIAGNTFPVTADAYDSSYAGNGDAFVLKLLPSSTDATPAAPVNLSAESEEAQVLLTWAEAPDADLAHTLIERSETSGSDFSLVQAVPAGTERWTNSDLTSGITYYYRARSEDAAGNLSEYTGEVSATPATPTDTESVGNESDRILLRSYPNPSQEHTRIWYAVPTGGDVELVIYDVTGREIDRLVSGYIQPGQHDVTWDASGYPSGTYFSQLTVDGESIVRQMVVVK